MDKIIAVASTLDNALLIQDEEEYDRLATEISILLKKVDISDPTWPTTLDGLDPSFLTIPFFRVLETSIDQAIAANKSTTRQLPASILPEGNLWPDISRALLDFDPIQIRYVGSSLTKIVAVVTQGAEQTGNLVPAIQLLQNVILRLDPTSTTLTSTHYYHVRLCLLARAYVEAITILDYPIYHIPTTDSIKQVGPRLAQYICSVHDSSIAYLNPQTGLTDQLTSRKYLEYYLLGAMCYMACGLFKQAQAFLEVVLTAPTQPNTTSLIQIHAYKKWLLVGLLITGNISELPKAINNNVAKHLRALGKPYECVVDAFKSGKLDRLQAEVQEGLSIWQDDGNYGLMVEIFAAFRKFLVLKLGKTFAALPVEQVSKRTSPTPDDVEETLRYVKLLIEAEEIHAVIEPSKHGGAGTLRFLSPQANQKSESEVEQELALKKTELKLLVKNISDYDHRLEVSRDYIEWLQKMKKARDTEKKSTKPANTMNMPGGFGPPPEIIDEDMMDDW